MKKVSGVCYLIDSENIKDTWIDLLDTMDEDDMLLVFYTVNSSHIRCEQVEKIMKKNFGRMSWIQCCEGNNALDFQLVTKLGALVAEHKAQEYVIVSRDTGFDAVVKFWRKENVSIRRIRGAYEEAKQAAKAASGSSKKKNTVPETAEPVTQEEVFPKQAAESAVQNVTAVPQSEAAASQNKTTVPQSEAAASQNKAIVPEREAAASQNKTIAAQSEAAASQNKAIVPEREAAASQNKTIAAQSEAAFPQDKIPVLQEEDYFSPDEIVFSPDGIVFPQEELPQTNLLIERREADWIGRMAKSISITDMSAFHNSLVAFYGASMGDSIYHALKRGTSERSQYKKAYMKDKRQRTRNYVELMLEMDDYDVKDASDLYRVLLKAPKKDLQKLHSLVHKKFGKEKGMQYYTLLKKHINIIRKI